jgi:uncharacterized protein YqfA (UPF0365 family)
MLLAQTAILVIVFAVIVVFLCVFSILVFVVALGPWLQANLLGVPIPLVRILAMRLRRIDVGAILRALILTREAGIDVSSSDMEWAYLQGVDLEKAVRTMIEAAREDPEISFRDVVGGAREGRHAEDAGRAAS